MTIAELERICKQRYSIRQGLPLRLSFVGYTPESGHGAMLSIRVTMETRDVESGRVIEIRLSSAISEWETERQGERFLELVDHKVRQACLNLLTHELDEMFLVDGQPLRKPHP